MSICLVATLQLLSVETSQPLNRTVHVLGFIIATPRFPRYHKYMKYILGYNRFRPRRSRSAAAYSRQTFRGRSVVRASVGLSSALWKNGGSDPDAVWHRRSDGSRDQADSGVRDRSTGRGTFGGEFGCAIVTKGDFTAYVCDSAATRPSFQVTLGRLVLLCC